MRLASIVFKLSKDPDFSGQTDGLTDGRTEGKPIVPSGVNTGRGLIKKVKNKMILVSYMFTDVFKVVTDRNCYSTQITKCRIVKISQTSTFIALLLSTLMAVLHIVYFQQLKLACFSLGLFLLAQFPVHLGSKKETNHCSSVS